ncbi:Ankrd28 [Symbiodinium sp. CCMP2592]|nr:Ankrd28 [Symbiodinium sp. CCMP2592]
MAAPLTEPADGRVRVLALSGNIVAEISCTTYPKECFLHNLTEQVAAQLQWPCARLELLLEGRAATEEDFTSGGDRDLQVIRKPLLTTYSRDILFAIRTGRVQFLKERLAAGQDPNSQLAWEALPLHEAVSRQQSDAVELLLAARADTGLLDLEGQTTLNLAVEGGAVELIDQLLAARADINKADKWERSPLNMVASTRDREMLLRLLEAQANVDQPDAKGDTPLHKAVSLCQVAMVEELLRARANVNRTNRRDQTPLDAAIVVAGTHAAQVVRILVRGGGDKDRMNGSGDTPLIAAIRHKSLAPLCALIDCSADLEKTDRDGATPLYAAAWVGFSGALTLLAGAVEVDKVNDCGDTALHAAAWQGHVDAVEQLVVARAIISAPS